MQGGLALGTGQAYSSCWENQPLGTPLPVQRCCSGWGICFTGSEPQGAGSVPGWLVRGKIAEPYRMGKGTKEKGTRGKGGREAQGSIEPLSPTADPPAWRGGIQGFWGCKGLTAHLPPARTLPHIPPHPPRVLSRGSQSNLSPPPPLFRLSWGQIPRLQDLPLLGPPLRLWTWHANKAL